MKHLAGVLFATALLAAPSSAEIITIEAIGTVTTNEITAGEPLGLVEPGETVVMTLEADSDNWQSFYPNLYRAYVISSFDLSFSGGQQISLLPGETSYFSLADDFYFGQDSFWVSNYFYIEPGKVPLAQQPFLYDFQLAYDGDTLNSVEILEALGSYDADPAILFGFRVWDSYFNNPDHLVMTFEFDRMTITSGSADTAQVRVIHLSPDAPAVDVLVDETLRPVTDLTFSNGTGYLDIDPGAYNFDVVPAGGSIGDSVLTIPLALEADTFYTAVAYDGLATISALALEDDESALPVGSSRLRAVHTAVGVGEVDFFDVPTFGPFAPLWQDLGFGVAGASLEVPAFPLRIGIDVDNDLVLDALFQLPRLGAGTSANVFAVTDAGGSLFLVVELRDGTTVRLDPLVFGDGFEGGGLEGWSTFDR